VETELPRTLAHDAGSPLSRGRRLLVGVDIGGTFTDCVVLDRRGRITATKCPSTPDDFAQGMLVALQLAGERLGLSFEAFCNNIAVLTHGTTVGTNALLQRRGSKVGLITTRGHEDAIHIMRGSRGVTARDIRKVVHFPESRKPDPIVPKRFIEGVSERVDCFGEVVVRLNESEAEAAIRRLVEQDVDAIGVCFLWSFKYPRHELRVKEMIRDLAPHLFVSCSVDLAPKWGEYERITATALNAYIGPVMAKYLGSLDRRLKASGYAQPLQITQCAGGSISVDKAMESPLLTLDSGPVSGVTGTQYLGRVMGCPNIITTDMGGTSFDVGIIFGGEPAYSFVSNVAQYEYFLPKVDIHAIGSGGGSLARVDRASKTLHVGPESAGADPGPACYGKGGTTATVTDADVVLGTINPDNFLGGRIKLDRDRAVAAVQVVAGALKLSLEEAASGIARIAEFKMSDIIRKMTVEKGFDPRDFVLFAFGGAGPAHAGVFAYELGVRKVIVPQKEIASSWCAFGAASADILHVYEQVDIQASPFDVARVNRALEALEKKADAQMARDGIAAQRRRFRFSLDMRHRGQINEVEVALPGKRLNGAFEQALRRRFSARYEQLYGRGSSYGEARAEIVTLRLRASAATPRPKLARVAKRARIDAKAAAGRRRIYWADLERAVATPIYDGARLVAGNRIAGPAVVETTDTTVVVHPGRRLAVDAFGNFEITFGK
ncbi:MAG TPA: hydantoinase/oxoprolinase family protein, partial [Casimicrobiaceae bacterium]|nr:hydantoinase/oxoprolinase family protein [Casimicrobiaceae bacterium]